MIRIHVLVENTSARDGLEAEHGLSLHVETPGIRLLMDMGQGERFAQNARRMGVDISAVDAAVLSHGHYDHGGGLGVFLAENQKAPVFIHRRAFAPHLSRDPDGRLRSIGLDAALRGHPRLIHTGDRCFLADGVELFGKVTEGAFYPVGNRSLLEQSGNALREDPFEHEQHLWIRFGEKAVLLVGCAHRGILNIMNRTKQIKRCYPDVVIGGFHLASHSWQQNQNEQELLRLGDALKETGAKFYAGHCTGDEPFRLLKTRLGEALAPLATGDVIEVAQL